MLTDQKQLENNIREAIQNSTTETYQIVMENVIKKIHVLMILEVDI